MQVSIRELKAHLSRYLAQARQGTALEITSHRRVVARVTGVPESGMPALGELIARGVAQWDGDKPQGAHIVLSKGGSPISRIVLEDRG
jgi:prevent-host-death family protein